MLKKFDAIDYLVKKYVDDGKHATIPIILEDKNDFFNKYDPTDTSLAPDVSEYLDKCSYNIPAQYKIRIDIVCNDLDQEYKEKMKDALKNHYGVLVFDNNIDFNILYKKTIALAVIGLLFILFVYLGNLINFVNEFAGTSLDVLKEILLITGWVFLWYSVENIFFDRKKLAEKRRDNIQMMNAEVMFENENEYYKILEEEEKEDIKENEEYEEIRESFLDQE